jgi:hypothetical protein
LWSARRACQIENRVNLDVEGERYVVTHRFKQGIGQQMRDIPSAAGEIIVDTNHLGAFGQQSLAQMGADETRTARDQNPAVFVISLK